MHLRYVDVVNGKKYLNFIQLLSITDYKLTNHSK